MSVQPVKCPTHKEYYLTNMCVLQQCTEPLCPECIPAHIRQHTSVGQIPQIENIQNVRQEQKAIVFDIVQKLNEQLFLLNNNDEKALLKNQQNKLDQAKEELINVIHKRFEEYKLELQSLFQQVNVKNDNKKEIVETVKQQQQKMQTLLKKFDSNDYIKAILETLLENIGPHIYQNIDKQCQTQQQQIPDVYINEKGLNQIKFDLDDYVQVNKQAPRKQRIVSVKDQEIEHEILGDKKENVQTLTNNVYIKSYQNSQISYNTKEYHSSQHSFKPQFVHNTSELMKAMQENPPQPLNIQGKQKILDGGEEMLVSCYGDQRRILIYRLPRFIQPLSKTNITDFQEINLILDKRIAVGHQCAVYGKEILIIGGIERDVDRTQSVATVYKVNLIQKTLNLHSNMIHRRQGFGLCVIDQMIYVCGGSSSDSEDNSINTLERFDGQRWISLRSCLIACTGCTLGNINNEFIIKIGGIDKEYLPVTTIEIYSIKQNIWFDLQVLDGFGNLWSDVPLYCGCEQINKTELLIFGGYIGDQFLDQSYVISLDIAGQTIRQAIIRKSHSLPTTGCVDQVKLFENQVYAVLTEGVHLIGAKKKVINCNSDKWIYIQNING